MSSARRLSTEEYSEGQVPGECELKFFTALGADVVITAAIDIVSSAVSSWSIANAESLDMGDVCGEVGDRTTSASDFDAAMSRGDGQGFGNPVYSRVAYQGTATLTDTKISSTLVSGILVSSFSGAPSDTLPDTMGYGRTFYTAHVNFGNLEGTVILSFPLLFHNPLGCLGEDIDLDYYGLAVVGYGRALNGTVASQLGAPDRDSGLPIRRERINTIVLDFTSLLGYVQTQLFCDVADEPVWTEAGYAMCSDSFGVLNVTTTVGGCPISVLPARFRAVGDFINGSLALRASQWQEELVIVQTEIQVQGVAAISALLTASNGVAQSTTQVGFPVLEANDDTEWILVLVVAVEVLLAVVFSMAYLVRTALRGIRRRRTTSRLEWAETLGPVLGLGTLLALGLIPVYLSWASEKDAANMAHNDLHTYTRDESVCGTASWQGGLVWGQWCTTLRTNSEALLVRSYSSTFKDRYAVLAVFSTVLGGALWLMMLVAKIRYAL